MDVSCYCQDSDVIMNIMTPLLVQPCTSKKIPKPTLLALCEENTPVTGGFPSQMASNTGSVSMPWHNHGGGSYSHTDQVKSHHMDWLANSMRLGYNICVSDSDHSFRPKTLHEPMTTYCQLDLKEYNVVESKSKHKYVLSKECSGKLCLQNDDHLVLASMINISGFGQSKVYSRRGFLWHNRRLSSCRITAQK